MAFVVGLTGGIGSGKTAVSDILQSRGIYVIDADVISRKVTSENESCLAKIAKEFPQCVENKNVNRRKLKELVFSSDEMLDKLNCITHSFIIDEIEQIIKNTNGLVVLVAPLLFEVGLQTRCNFIVCVTCDEQTRINRIVNRDNITKDLALKIISSQMSESEKIAKCNYVLYNDADIQSLNGKVDVLLSKIVEAMQN